MNLIKYFSGPPVLYSVIGYKCIGKMYGQNAHIIKPYHRQDSYAEPLKCLVEKVKQLQILSLNV